jgi:hypothetical protein
MSPSWPVTRRRLFIVELDHRLLYEARRLMTGANVHRLQEMIFVYVQAVDLHNRDWPSHHQYQPEHEVRLRRYVMQDRLKWLDQAVKVARVRAESLSKRSARLHECSEKIETSYQEWRHEHAHK